MENIEQTEIKPNSLGLKGSEETKTASTRKSQHLDLAQHSLVSTADPRFFYEPMLAAHPPQDCIIEASFFGKKLDAPLWISSMTGGTDEAYFINKNLATVAREFNIGMGLGSCRSLLSSDRDISHFSWRKTLGPDLPLLANLGIAQIEKLVREQNFSPLEKLMEKLEVDGLIVHINPLQEWLQPEGDRLHLAPISTLEVLLKNFKHKVMVKEVGQGMGPSSIQKLFALNLHAFEFAALGGTNFSKLEITRRHQNDLGLEALAHVGHNALDMVMMVREVVQKNQQINPSYRPPELVISGGLQSFLDIHFLSEKLGFPCLGGLALAMLKRARISADELRLFVRAQVQGLALAQSFLKIRS